MLPRVCFRGMKSQMDNVAKSLVCRRRREIKRSSLGIDERLVANVEGKWLAVGMNETEMWMAQSTATTSTQSKSKGRD